MNRQYRFENISHCEICGDQTKKHKVLGQRLNQSQGLSPKKKIGITVSIQQCSNCKLIYSNPQPIPKSIQDHYGSPPEEYWEPEYFNWKPTYFADQIGQAKSLLDFKSGMMALDIGAGLGKAMLSLENAGFDTYGLEPSIPFYEKSISEMKISSKKLKLGAIETLEYKEGSFDFITFGAVFEHLYKPADCLAKAINWLKPNGILHIEVPSSNWLISKVINMYYTIIGTNYVTNLSPMHPPYHLYEFDLKSFESLSRIQDFKIETHHYDVCTIQNIPKIFHPLLRYFMKKTSTGMQLTIYLRKESNQCQI